MTAAAATDIAGLGALVRTAARHPAIGFPGEEMDAAEQQRLLGGGVDLWILDPFDGTNNFAAGIPLFGVSLAPLHAG